MLAQQETATKEEEAQKPRINDFTFQAATINGSGSQSSNLIIARTLFSMGIPIEKSVRAMIRLDDWLPLPLMVAAWKVKSLMRGFCASSSLVAVSCWASIATSRIDQARRGGTLFAYGPRALYFRV